MSRIILAIALLIASIIITQSESHAGGFNQFVGFGDSTLDTGYFRYNPPAAPVTDQMIAAAVAAGAKGGYAGPGTMDATFIAARFGLSAEPFGHGGTNFANGGAHTLVESDTAHVSTVQQIEKYLASVQGSANPRGLYVVSTGNNDYIYTMKQGPAWIAANPGYLTGLVAPLTAKVASLQSAGARTLVVPNTFIYAAMAGLGGDLPLAITSDYARLMAFNGAVWTELTKAGVRFIPADMDSVFKYVVHHPTQFGFTPDSVLSKNAPSKVSALLTTSAMISPEQDQSFLFIDGAHLTTGGQKIEADYIIGLLTAPSLVSQVVEGAVQTGLSRTAHLQARIEGFGRPPAPTGARGWASFGSSSLRLRNDPGFQEISATGIEGMVGVDRQLAGGVLLGAALTVGEQKLHFSSGGNCDQVEEALSLYAAYKTERIWGDAMVTFGIRQDQIERQVQMGIFSEHNRADTNGRTLGLALRGGHEFCIGSMDTGPVVGLNLQQVRLNGFTETGTSGVTALRFLDQTRNAFISQLGWRAGLNLGGVQVSATAEWNHDFKSESRTVTAALTSTNAAPFSASSAPVPGDWATVKLGAACRISSRLALHVNGLATFGNPEVRSYGGTANLSFNF